MIRPGCSLPGGAATPPDTLDLPYRDTLRDALDQAGATALRWLHTAVRPDVKADGSEVTEADKRAEDVLVGALARAFPRCGVVSEEGSLVEGTDGTWYVDPIDGTSAFVEGLAHWGPTVCLVRDGRLEVGAFWQPRLGEFWYAARDRGAWRDDVRLQPRALAAIDRNDSVYLPSRFHRAMPIAWPGKVRALGCTAAHLALVASGGAAATIAAGWALWDVGCGALLVTEAGRVVTDLTGAPFAPMELRGPAFLAGDAYAVRHLVENALAARRPGVER